MATVVVAATILVKKVESAARRVANMTVAGVEDDAFVKPWLREDGAKAWVLPTARKVARRALKSVMLRKIFCVELVVGACAVDRLCPLC